MGSSRNKSIKGMVQVYTGDGQGKTAATLGQALRAAGQGMKVIIIQFIKGDRNCGEHSFSEKYHPFEIVQLNKHSSSNQSLAELKSVTEQTLAFADEKITEATHDMVVLDEILLAVNKKLITTEQVMQLVNKKAENMDLIMTGRGAPPEIMRIADLVTEMKAVKHSCD